MCTFPWNFELYMSFWAKCPLQNPETSSSRCMLSVVITEQTTYSPVNTELWQGDPWKSASSAGPLFCPGPMGFFQAEPWTGQSLLSWHLGLWSCLIPCSCLSGLWTLSGGCPVTPAALINALCWISQQKKCFSVAGVAEDIMCWPFSCSSSHSGIRGFPSHFS